MGNNELLGGLGGLVKGLSGIMPQDDPAVKLLNAQTEVNDLKSQEEAIYTEIGKLAFTQNPGAFPAQADKLRLIQANLLQAEATLKVQEQESQKAEQVAKEAANQLTCPNCAHQNSDGTKFCQECGSELGIKNVFCPGCGLENPPGTRFCGGCGQPMGV